MFFNNSAFAFCMVFEWITKCDAFAGKWKSEYYEGGNANEVFIKTVMIYKSGKVNIKW